MNTARPPMLSRWLDERVGLTTLRRVVFLRNVPLGVGILYTLGFAASFVLLLQILTGTVLALYYVPAPGQAYESVAFLTWQVPFGRIVRGLHHWGSSAMVVLVAAHLMVVFALGAYKRPREITWLIGTILLGLTLAFAFTGYLLPWDEKAYWATNVGTNMIGTVPLIGDFLLRVARGGSELGAATLPRFYAVHTLILPGAMVALVASHIALVIWHGVSVPPSLWNAERQAVARQRSEAIAAGSDPDTVRYAAFKQAGRPFWPDVILEDLIVAVIVFGILLALTLIEGAPLGAPADPSNASYIPRPEWYFLFLFQLLRYFPGELEWLGVVLLPLLGFASLVFLPFLDPGPERRLLRRPIARTVAIMLAAGFGFLTTTALLTTPPAVAEERGVTLTGSQILGRTHFRQYCAGCHGASGEGTADGPSLIGLTDHRDANYVHSYIEEPQKLARTALMPSFLGQIGHQQVEEITQYVLTFSSERAR